MLGLRGGSLKRTKSTSTGQKQATSDTPSNGAMAMTSAPMGNGDEQNGIRIPEPLTSPPITPTKLVPGDKSDGRPNGTANRNDRYAPSSITRGSESRMSTTKSEGRLHFSKDQQVTVLRESVTSTRVRFITDFAHVDEGYIDTMTIDGFLDYIERQRLSDMPHRGSRWDKVLKWAEFFALQISGYATAVESFIPNSMDAAKLMWAASRLLLELGPENDRALEQTFGVFYDLGLSLAFLLQHNQLLRVNGQIRMEAGEAFNDLLNFVRDVSVYFRMRIDSASSDEISFDFNTTFGRSMEGFYRRKNHITDAMWEHNLGDNITTDIRTIREWLSPQDRTLRKLLKERDLAKGRRDEYTCEWFQRYLLDFSRGKDDIFAITGPAGCGKSKLAGWIIERLQRPLGRKTYTTLSCTIEADIKGETTSLAIVKRLLLQLLDSNVGDPALFDALLKAYNFSLKTHDISGLEHQLWIAFDTGLGSATGKLNNIIIVVDGLDKVKGGETRATIIRNHLGEITSKHGNVQTLLLSQSHSQTKKGKTQHLSISPDHAHNDIRHMIEHSLRRSRIFQDHTEFEQEAFVEQIAHAAKGNFLWVALTTAILRKEISREGFTRALKIHTETPKSLTDAIQNVVGSLDLSKPDTNLVLSWLLAAERPLTTAEVSCLLRVDIQKKHLGDRKVDIGDIVNATGVGGLLVIVKNGFVQFRHAAIRSHFIKLQAEEPRFTNRVLAQTDLASRILAYSKFVLSSSNEPTLEGVGINEVIETFGKHPLLEYAVRYWILHFEISTMHTDGVLGQISDSFKAVFPSTTQLAVFEWACWETQSSPFEALRMHDLALRVRQECLTEKVAGPSVLQTLIVCGSLHRKVKNNTESAKCFYRAAHIGQTVLRKNSTITSTCATTFLTITETIVITSRTEIFTHKEEMLKYVIQTCKHQHGRTSDTVIRYYQQLIQLYVDIHEEHQAEVITRELREIMVVKFGKGSEEERSVSEQLTFVLKKGDKQQDVVEYEKTIFEAAMEMETWDSRRIKKILELALSYEARGESFLAEEQYITLFGQLTEQCHHSHHNHGIEIHISLIDVALEYVRFLRRCHRHEEASSILICIWTEYEEYYFDSESLFLRLKSVGELMRTVSLLSIAISVFKKCWAWFKSHEKHEHTASLEILISETVQEIITTTSTSTKTITTKTMSVSQTEVVIKEIFESSMSRSTITSETITICRSLISFYMGLELWSQAVEVTKRSLLLLWKVVVSGRGTIALPREFGSESIDIAINLAICHHRSHHFHEAEEVYLRIYHACRNSCQVRDDRLTRSYTVLIEFYREYRHWAKMIAIYREMLTEYRRLLGPAHTLTIRTLYSLAALCSDHGDDHVHEYYEEIITTLNGDSKVCHHDAIEAMIIMCRRYYEGGFWQALVRVCDVLWETWIRHHHEHNFSEDFIEVLYMRYCYVLDRHFHREWELIQRISVEYRNTSVKVFGATASIAIKATIELAQVYMRSEKHVHEAIQAYEEVLTKTSTLSKSTTTVVSTTTITTIRERLAKCYVTVCSQDSVSATILEKAIKVTLERFEYLKLTFSCSNTETLNALQEYISLCIKLKTQEAHSRVMRILFETTVDIISKEKHSRTLFEAAKQLGGLFIKCALVERGWAILHDMRRQIVGASTASPKDNGFKLDRSIGKVSYVFLVTFEETLRGTEAISYTGIMAGLLRETFLYESYTRSVKSNMDIELILRNGARYRTFLIGLARKDEAATLEGQLYEIFVKKWGHSIKTQRQFTLIFFSGLLDQLGKDTQNNQIGNAACLASNVKVLALLEESSYPLAYEVALCSLQFINSQRAYHQLQNVPHGFRLSALMAGRGLKRPLPQTIEPKVREDMLKLSRIIIREVLQACKESKIEFTRLQLNELNELAGLLGDQQNFDDLEWLLNLLWSSRQVQKYWKPDTIISIGRLLVQARFLAGPNQQSSRHQQSAIRLCEDICYNLRRARGSLHPETLEMSDLLSQVYTAKGHFREAMGVHENILRLVTEGDDGDDRTIDTMSSEDALKHLNLLHQSYLRLGGFDKSDAIYKELVDALISMEVYKNKPEWKKVESTNKWSTKEKPHAGSTFVPPKDWEFANKGLATENGKVVENGHGWKEGRSMKRASSAWGLGQIHRILYGDHEHEEVPPLPSQGVYSNGTPK